MNTLCQGGGEIDAPGFNESAGVSEPIPVGQAVKITPDPAGRPRLRKGMMKTRKKLNADRRTANSAQEIHYILDILIEHREAMTYRVQIKFNIFTGSSLA